MNRNDFEELRFDEQMEKQERLEKNVDKEFLWFKSREVTETKAEVKEKLEQLEVRNIDLEGMVLCQDLVQIKMSGSVC